MADLKSFVQSQLAQQKQAQQFDWTRRKEKWLTELEQLLALVRRSLLDAGFPAEHLHSTKHSLREDSLGVYEAPGLEVTLPAGGRVTFRPVSSVIVGGYGRVDVTGPVRESVKLIVDDADDDRPESDETPSYEREWAWHVYPSRGLYQSFPLKEEQDLAKLLSLVVDSH